jgi:hypothetical protein
LERREGSGKLVPVGDGLGEEAEQAGKAAVRDVFDSGGPMANPAVWDEGTVEINAFETFVLVMDARLEMEEAEQDLDALVDRRFVFGVGEGAGPEVNRVFGFLIEDKKDFEDQIDGLREERAKIGDLVERTGFNAPNVEAAFGLGEGVGEFSVRILHPLNSPTAFKIQ